MTETPSAPRSFALVLGGGGARGFAHIPVIELLDELGVPHTGIVDETEPIAYSTVVFRDPDNIQLELIAMD